MRVKRTLQQLNCVTKKMKMCDLPINSDTINKVLPQWSSEDLENTCQCVDLRMKKATDTVLSLDDAKKLVLMIIDRPALEIPLQYTSHFMKMKTLTHQFICLNWDSVTSYVNSCWHQLQKQIPQTFGCWGKLFDVEPVA